MSEPTLQPIILCGGNGSRLWPLSRESFPKQYLNLIGNDKISLFQRTLLRVKKFVNIEDPIIICNEQHRFIVAEQIREIDIKSKLIILEPEARNTAPPVAVGAISSMVDNKDQVLLVLAADHYIQDEKKFIKVLESGFIEAKKDKLITFGITPTSPETGFGYIESEKELSDDNISSKIERFIEKPNFKLANKLYLDKRFSWNSGIFMFKASQIIKEFKEYFPEIINLCSSSLDSAEKDLDFLRLSKDYFLKCPNISFDHAIMEKTELGFVLPLNAGWKDIGSWDALWEKEKKDNLGNVIKGNVLIDNTKDSYIRSESRLVTCSGIQDLIVVETSDSILITKKSLSQNVKTVVKNLQEKGFVEAKCNEIVYRPWGHYKSISEDLRWQVKKIEVKPGASLSLQMHHHRSEHWVIVSGTALVEIEDKEKLYGENQSVYVPLGSKHRLSNPGKLKLTLIEVQSGSYLGEDDIHRLEDKYGR